MDHGGSSDIARKERAESNSSPRVDATPPTSVHFAPPVKEWIEYLADRLAREVIRESQRPAA